MLTYKPLIYLLTTFLLTLMASSCFQLSGSGSNGIMKNTANDSKTKKAVLFLKTGGATTDNSLQVSVIDFKENYLLKCPISKESGLRKENIVE